MEKLDDIAVIPVEPFEYELIGFADGEWVEPTTRAVSTPEPATEPYEMEAE